jgi:membrane protease YdiL (CAAX protease family)
MPDRLLLLNVFELSLLLAGAVLLWRYVLSPAARRTVHTSRLAPWNTPLLHFFIFLWLILTGGIVVYACSTPLLRFFAVSDDVRAAVATAAVQLGWIGGFIAHGRIFPAEKIASDSSHRPFFLAGVATFLISLPVVEAVGLIWQGLLQLCGLPLEKQDLIRLFLDAKSPTMLVTMIALACIGAPIAEELIFRAGIFRFLRTRAPRWAALALPACIFAAVHLNLANFVPLAALGIVFSLAYERTGTIKTAMVAHALFNTTSVIRLFVDPNP